jgi:putative nucleotidyltransferase with HDIG domain
MRTPAGREPERSPAAERVHHRLGTLHELTPAPEIAVRLVGLIDGNASARDIAALIARDPALMASLLRVANSAAFGARARLTNLQQLITLLGFTRVRQLALAVALWDQTSAAAPSVRTAGRRLWQHSVTTAVVSRELATRLRGVDPEAAYVTGLLHDIGQLALGTHAGASYWETFTAADDEAALIAAEEARFGCHHATVGGWLLEMWGLSPGLVQPVASHHRGVLPHHEQDLASVVVLGDHVAGTLGATGTLPAEAQRACESGLGIRLTEDDWSRLAAAMRREREGLQPLFAG